MESLSDRLNRVQPTFGRLPWGAEPRSYPYDQLNRVPPTFGRLLCGAEPRSYPQPYWVPQSASGGHPGHVVGGEVQSSLIQPILQGQAIPRFVTTHGPRDPVEPLSIT